MKIGETLGNVASFVAVVGAGIVLFKFYKGASALVEKGAKVGDAVVEQVKKTVGEDLNPASDKNVVYTAANSLGQTVTNDPSWNIGSRLWEFLNPSKVADERGMLSGATPSNVTRQTELMEISQDNFRRAEINATNQDAKDAAAAEDQMSRSRSQFRLSEIREQGGMTRTDSDQFMYLLRTHG